MEIRMENKKIFEDKFNSRAFGKNILIISILAIAILGVKYIEYIPSDNIAIATWFLCIDIALKVTMIVFTIREVLEIKKWIKNDKIYFSSKFNILYFINKGLTIVSLVWLTIMQKPFQFIEIGIEKHNTINSISVCMLLGIIITDIIITKVYEKWGRSYSEIEQKTSAK